MFYTEVFKYTTVNRLLEKWVYNKRKAGQQKYNYNYLSALIRTYQTVRIAYFHGLYNHNKYAIVCLLRCLAWPTCFINLHPLPALIKIHFVAAAALRIHLNKFCKLLLVEQTAQLNAYQTGLPRAKVTLAEQVAGGRRACLKVVGGNRLMKHKIPTAYAANVRLISPTGGFAIIRC